MSLKGHVLFGVRHSWIGSFVHPHPAVPLADAAIVDEALRGSLERHALGVGARLGDVPLGAALAPQRLPNTGGARRQEVVRRRDLAPANKRVAQQLEGA